MLRRVFTLAVLAGMLCAPAVAQGDAFDDVFRDYQKDGQISPCRHTAADLRKAKRQIPNDIEQYAPDFPDALDQALEDRARTGCAKSAAAGATTTATAGGSGATGSAGTAAGAAPGSAAGAPGPAGTGAGAGAPANPSGSVPQPPGAAQPAAPASDGAIVSAADRTAARGADGTPAPLIALAILAALVLLALALWALARFFAWDPVWLAGARHATQEAGWHVSGLWDDFTDWLRPGRRGPA